MERYETEEQQVEAIKQFWKENGTAIIFGAVLGLGGLWSWRWYNDSQMETKAQASLAYSEIVEQAAAGNSTETQAFIEEHGNTAYGSLGGLIAAQQSVIANDLVAAEASLKSAIDLAKSEAISDLARIRLARIQLAQSNYDAALKSLSDVKNLAFSDQVEEVRGDIYLAQNDFDKARIAYTSVLDENDNNTDVKTKLSNIAFVETQASGVSSEN